MPTGSNQGKSKNSMSAIIGIAVCAVLVILLFLIFHKPTINLNKYIKVDFTGYETVGHAKYSFDYEQFNEDYGKKLKYTAKAKKELKSELGNFSTAIVPAYTFELISPLTVTVEPSDKLSNGDEVKVNVDLNEDIEKYFKANFKAKDMTLKVDGLELAETFNPFDGIKINFTGTSPYGTANYEIQDNSFIGGVEIDKTEGLSNGDTIKVTMKSFDSYSYEEYCINNYGKIPTETEKEYTVEGLPSYVSSASEIPDDVMNKMKKEAEDKIQSISASWDKEVTLKDYSYVGNYYLLAKDSGGWGDSNYLYVIYKVNAIIDMPDKNYTGVATYYYPLGFKNIMKLPDDTFSVDLSDHREIYDSFNFETVQSSWGYMLNYSFYGYQDVESMFAKLVTSNMDNYTYEDNFADSNPTE